MAKMKSYEELKLFCLKKVEQKKRIDTRIVVVLSKCSLGVGAGEVLEAIHNTVYSEKMDNVIVEITGCMGMCSEEPLVIIHDSDGRESVYNLVTPTMANAIAISHGIYGKQIKPWLLMNKNEED